MLRPVLQTGHDDTLRMKAHSCAYKACLHSRMLSTLPLYKQPCDSPGARLSCLDTFSCFQVQLCYATAIIAVTMCVAYLTPSADRNPLLWCSPLLQLLPVCAMAFNQRW